MELNINILPVYESLTKQWHKRRFANYHPIYTQNNVLPNFQFTTDNMSSTIAVILYDKNGVQLANLTPATVGVSSKSYGTYQVIYCVGIADITVDLPNLTPVYLQIKVGTGVSADYFYTDLFEGCSNYYEMIKLTYWNITDQELGDEVIFAGTSGAYFPFVMYIPQELGKPKFQYFNKVDEKDGIEYPLVLKARKDYMFPIRLSEPQFDAFSLIPTFDKIAIESNGELLKCMNFQISEPEWNEKGIATCEVTFSTSTLVRRLSNARPTRGDFNDDFNNYFI